MIVKTRNSTYRVTEQGPSHFVLEKIAEDREGKITVGESFSSSFLTLRVGERMFFEKGLNSDTLWHSSTVLSIEDA